MRVLLLGVMAIAVGVQGAELPTSFFAVHSFSSDGPPHWSVGILDVRVETGETIVRQAHLKPPGNQCPGLTVRLAESRSTIRTMRDLIGEAKICGIRSGELNREFRVKELPDLLDHPSNYTIVANCGQKGIRVLKLPQQAWRREKSLARRAPRIAGVRSLFWDVSERAFGEGGPFRGLSEDEDYALQEAAKPFVYQLRGGAFIPPDEDWDWLEMLAAYQGPKRGGYLPIPYWDQAESTPGLRFKEFEAPQYPHLAVQARIQGPTSVQVSRSPQAEATVDKGHPLLVPAVKKAANEWQVDWSSIDGDSATVAIRFDLTHCGDQESE